MKSTEPYHDFAEAARNAGLDPNNRWVGGYVDYELTHLWPILDAYRLRLEGKSILEFGCNVGASSVVMAKLGGVVTGIDVDPSLVEVAAANIKLHGVEAHARALHMADTRAMRFRSRTFDFVLANSVLEYVPTAFLNEVLAEIHRVMKPGARLLIVGTASRLAPREIHSRRWLVNYLPTVADKIIGKPLQRGLSPLHLHRAITNRFEIEARERWLPAREGVHGKTGLAVRAVSAVAHLIGIAPGWLSPNIELLLRRV